MASIYYVHVNLIKNYKLIWKKDTLNNYLEFASFFEYVVIWKMEFLWRMAVRTGGSYWLMVVLPSFDLPPYL